MKISQNNFLSCANDYLNSLRNCFSDELLIVVEELAKNILTCWSEGKNVFICGNGGSAANAIHIANDFHYGIGACGEGPVLPGLKVEALPANSAIITCLANDTGYENIYSNQIKVKGQQGDLLIVLSGSGNSPNIVNALKTASEMQIKSFALLAFTGGACLELADVPIHFPIDDMQIAEDTQLVVGHLCMQWLSRNKPTNPSLISLN